MSSHAMDLVVHVKPSSSSSSGLSEVFSASCLSVLLTSPHPLELPLQWKLLAALLGVNSGVMLMNLTRMRQCGWIKQMVNYYETYRYDITWGDQDLINIFFHFFPGAMTWHRDKGTCNWATTVVLAHIHKHTHTHTHSQHSLLHYVGWEMSTVQSVVIRCWFIPHVDKCGWQINCVIPLMCAILNAFTVSETCYKVL